MEILINKKKSRNLKGNKKAYMRGFEEKRVKGEMMSNCGKIFVCYVKMCCICLIICKNVLLFYLVCLRHLISLTKSSTANSKKEV